MKLPRYIIPILVVVTLFSGYYLRAAFTQPSTSVSFVQSEGKTVTCIVDGVKCKGTANFFTKLYSEVSGIISIETYAADHKAVITYDPESITPEDIKAVMEQQIPMRDGTQRQVFTCVSMREH